MQINWNHREKDCSLISVLLGFDVAMWGTKCCSLKPIERAVNNLSLWFGFWSHYCFGTGSSSCCLPCPHQLISRASLQPPELHQPDSLCNHAVKCLRKQPAQGCSLAQLTAWLHKQLCQPLRQVARGAGWGETAAQHCYQQIVPLGRCSRVGDAKRLSYISRGCQEGLCLSHFTCVGSSIWRLPQSIWAH